MRLETVYENLNALNPIMPRDWEAPTDRRLLIIPLKNSYMVIPVFCISKIAVDMDMEDDLHIKYFGYPIAIDHSFSEDIGAGHEFSFYLENLGMLLEWLKSDSIEDYNLEIWSSMRDNIPLIGD